jgi:protein gp37
VSPSCTLCYAAAADERYNWTPEGWGPGKPRKETTSTWRAIERLNERSEGALTSPRVFTASLADWLDLEAPPGALDRFWARVKATTNLTWLLLSKRPENYAKLIGEAPPPHVWLGVTGENQLYWDERLHYLFEIPATVRFVSAEPLLGPITIDARMLPDWIIAGGESGPKDKIRMTEIEWFRGLRDQALDLNVAFFFKQLGGSGLAKGGDVLDGERFFQLPTPKDR